MSTALQPAQSIRQNNLAVSGRLAEMGKVKIGRLGDPRQSQRGTMYRLPQMLDHFLITSLQRGPDGNFALDETLMRSLIEEGYGDNGKLHRIPVMAVDNDLRKVVRQRFVWYVGKKRGGESDGITLTLWFHPRTQKPLPKPMVLSWQPESGDVHADVEELVAKGAFKLSTTFNFIINSKHAKFGGVYKFRTTGQVNGDQLPSSLAHLKDLTGGLLRLLPLVLVLRPMEVCPFVEGVPTPSTIQVVHVEQVGNTIAGFRQLAREQLRQELADAQETRKAIGEYRQLIMSANFETFDMEPGEDGFVGGGERPQLQASGKADDEDDEEDEDSRDSDETPLEPTQLPANAPSHTEPSPVTQPAGVPAESEKSSTSVSVPPADPIHDTAALESLLALKGVPYRTLILNINGLAERKGKPKYKVETPWLEVDEESRVKTVQMARAWKDKKVGGKTV